MLLKRLRKFAKKFTSRLDHGAKITRLPLILKVLSRIMLKMTAKMKRPSKLWSGFFSVFRAMTL